MINLGELIIQRINLIQELHHKESNRITSLGKTNTLETQFQNNRIILKFLSTTKKEEKSRKDKEVYLLQEIEEMRFWQSQVLQNLYLLASNIFRQYLPCFQLPSNINSSLSAKVQSIFTSFFSSLKQNNSTAGMNMIRGEIVESTPRSILGWLCEWSSKLLHLHLQQLTNLEFDWHQDQMKRLNMIRNTALRNQRLMNPLSISTHLQRTNDSTPSLPTFTNKQSIFGLIIDQLHLYYKSLPLQLDSSYLKTIRKIHNRGIEFERDDILSKAAEILTETKNKSIKENRDNYRQFYLGKFPQYKMEQLNNQNMIERQRSERGLQRKKQAVSDSPRKRYKKQIKPPQNYQRIIQRIKSQKNQEDNYIIDRTDMKNHNRKSLLLCPNKKQIAFDQHNLFSKKGKERDLKKIQLPQINQNKFLACHSKSTATRAKPLQISGSGIGEGEGWKISPKIYDFKMFSNMQKQMRNNGMQNSVEGIQMDKREGEQLRRNRKLMLQLLRQKNRSIFER